MTGTVKEIVASKRREGEDSWLCLRPSGECVLYEHKEDSVVGETCQEPVGEWDLDPIERDQLIETGLVDCQD